MSNRKQRRKAEKLQKGFDNEVTQPFTKLCEEFVSEFLENMGNWTDEVLANMVEKYDKRWRTMAHNIINKYPSRYRETNRRVKLTTGFLTFADKYLNQPGVTQG